MVGNKEGDRDQANAAKTNDHTPVPRIEQGTGQHAENKAEACQQEARHQVRIRTIALRRRCERRKRTFKFLVESLAALATVGIVFLTGVYVYYSSKQWQAMRNQNQILQKQIDLTVREFKATEAPDLMFGDNSGTTINIAKNIPNWASIWVFFRNVGRSTAARTFLQIHPVIVERGTQSKPFTLTYPTEMDLELNGKEIGPSSSGSGHLEIPLRSFQTVEQKRASLKVFVRLVYQDAFGSQCVGFEAMYQGADCGFIVERTVRTESQLDPICGKALPISVSWFAPWPQCP